MGARRREKETLRQVDAAAFNVIDALHNAQTAEEMDASIARLGAAVEQMNAAGEEASAKADRMVRVVYALGVSVQVVVLAFYLLRGRWWWSWIPVLCLVLLAWQRRRYQARRRAIVERTH